MKNTPESVGISVCVPIYNGARFLPECLESVAAQSFLPAEVLLVDNASTDASLEACQAFEREYPLLKIRVLPFEEHVGMGANWNRAVEQARSPWVKVLPCDDRLGPEILARQAAVAAQYTGLSLVTCGKELIDGTGKPLFSTCRLREGRHAGLRTIRRCLSSPANLLGEPASGLFRKADFDRVGGFRTDMSYYLDLDFWIRLLERGDLWVIRRPLYQFRVHGAGASAGSRRRACGEFLLLNRIHGRSGRLRHFWLKWKTIGIAWARDLVIRFYS